MSVIFRLPGGLWLGGFLAFSSALLGQTSVAPQGTEFSILGGIPGDQVWPTVSLSSTGGVLAWQDSAIDKNGGGLGSSVLNTEFSAGAKSRVNSITTGNHYRPQVQLLANGNVLYVWQSTVSGTPSIYARFAKNAPASASSKKSSAEPASSYGTNFYTADIRVNTHLPGQKADPAVAALPDGSAIIVWSSYGQDGSMFGVFGRHLSSTGVGGKEFQVNQFTHYNQRNAAVAALPNGNFVVTWISEQERNLADVYARVYTDAGVALTDELPVNTGTFPCSSPAVAPLSDGGFTVVWAQHDTNDVSNGWDVWGRAFSASGMPVASDFGINTYLIGDQYQPKIAAGPAGSMVVWTSMGEDGSQEGVYGRFLAGGTQPTGSEFRVNTTTISKQMHPSVAWDGVGNFLVVWASFAGQTGFDIYGQLYVLTP
jgi:hypothetical protein